MWLCKIHYNYDSFTVMNPNNTSRKWHITAQRKYLLPTTHLAIPTKVIEEVEQQIVLHVVRFHSEAIILGIGSRQLKKALFTHWMMRYQREQRQYYVFNHTQLWNLIRDSNAG